MVDAGQDVLISTVYVVPKVQEKVCSRDFFYCVHEGIAGILDGKVRAIERGFGCALVLIMRGRQDVDVIGHGHTAVVLCEPVEFSTVATCDALTGEEVVPSSHESHRASLPERMSLYRRLT